MLHWLLHTLHTLLQLTLHWQLHSLHWLHQPSLLQLMDHLPLHTLHLQDTQDTIENRSVAQNEKQKNYKIFSILIIE
jgi:hypothetical protein